MSHDHSFTLRISFAGLCAFVPRGEDLQALRRMDIILPTVEGDEYCIKHIPLLAFDLKNLVVTPGYEPPARIKGTWRLAYEDLTVHLRDRCTKEEVELESEIKLLQGRKPGDKPAYDYSISDEDERRADLLVQAADFSWLPSLRLVLDDAADIKPELVNAVYPDNIAARVRLRFGNFGSHSLAAFKNDFIIAQFCPQVSVTRPFRQSLAHWAGADIILDDRFDVIVRATKYGSHDHRDLLLRPIRGKQLKVEISNLCYFDDSYGQDVRPTEDSDFRHFYTLSKRAECLKKYSYLPIPVAIGYPALSDPDGPAAGGADPLRCTGTVFEVLPLPEEEVLGADQRLQSENGSGGKS